MSGLKQIRSSFSSPYQGLFPSPGVDLCMIAVDAFKKLVKTPLDDIEMEKFFENLNAVSDAHHCRFVLSISSPEDEVPEYIRKYAL